MVQVAYSFAKINLFLDVLGIRADNFHDILSVMVPIDWHDTFILREHETEKWTTTGEELARFPLGELTIGRAIEKIRPYRKNMRGFHLHLHKRVPYNAGLGIASSNAVHTLKLFNKHWDCRLSHEELAFLSEDIGSDCPFFFSHSVCEVREKGNKILPMGPKPYQYPLGIFVPKYKGISTVWAYEEIRASQNYGRHSAQGERLIAHWGVLSWQDLLQGVQNTFFDCLSQKDAELRAIYKLLKTPDNVVQMSGSGASFFAIFKNHNSLDQFFRSHSQELENNFDFYSTIL